jgi:hypothetical protein
MISTNYTGPAIWRNADSDLPIKIIGYLGQQNRQDYFAIEGSTTGVPGEQIKLSALDFLKQYPFWVGWKYEPDEKGELTKVPKSPKTGGNAQSNNPGTWGSFEQASAAKDKLRLDGIGFMLKPDAIPLVAFDLDHCLNNGELSPVAMEIVKTVPTYTEITPSGEGLRLFALGDLPEGRRKMPALKIECYDKGRFLTVTGNHLPGTPEFIEHRDSEIAEVHKRFWSNGNSPKEPGHNGHTPHLSLSDIELLTKARAAGNGSKFARLWNGDTSGHNDNDSSADLALCDMLAFWTGGDSSQIDRLFRQSKLYRPKWDKKHSGNGSTYGQMTIAKALAQTTEFYSLAAGQPTAPTVQPKSIPDGSKAETVFKRLSLAELIQRPPKIWLIDNLLGEQDLAMIFGDAGTGKTFATVDLIFSAILGRPFAGGFSINRPLSVAYTASEGIGGLSQRFCAGANHYQIDLGRTDKLSLFLDVPQLFDEKTITSVYTFVSNWLDSSWGNLDLLIIDTLHGASWGADENQSKDAGLILRAMKYARDRLGCSVLLVHHANRQGNYRGSSALHGAMDSMFQTKMVSDNIFSLECFKQKDSERFQPLFFKLTPEYYSQSAYVDWLDKNTIELNDDPAPKTTKAKEAILNLLRDKPGLNQSAIVAELTKYARMTVLKALDELEKNGSIKSATGPRNSTVYTISELSSGIQLD